MVKELTAGSLGRIRLCLKATRRRGPHVGQREVKAEIAFIAR